MMKRGIVVDNDQAAPEANIPATKNPVAEWAESVKPNKLAKIRKCEPIAGFITPVRSQIIPVTCRQRQAKISLLPPKKPVIWMSARRAISNGIKNWILPQEKVLKNRIPARIATFRRPIIGA